MLRLRSTLPAPGRKETKSRNTSLSQIMDYLHRQPERGERGVKGVTSHEKRRRRPLSRAFHFLFLFVLSDRNAAALLVRAFSDMFLQRDANLSLRRKFKKTKKNSGRNEYKAVCWKHYRRRSSRDNQERVWFIYLDEETKKKCLAHSRSLSLIFEKRWKKRPFCQVTAVQMRSRLERWYTHTHWVQLLQRTATSSVSATAGALCPGFCPSGYINTFRHKWGLQNRVLGSAGFLK